MAMRGPRRLGAGRKGKLEMNTSTHTQSATILQFPAGGRRGLAANRAKADAAEAMAERVSNAIGSAWYHEEAIREAAGPTKS